MSKVIYKEEQKFGQPWIWMIIIPVNMASLLFFAFGFNEQLIDGKAFGDNPMPNVELIIAGIVTLISMIGLTILFYKMKLVVEIQKDGIHFRYPPMINKFKVILKEEIDRFEVREYKPIAEYGGWGIKKGTKKYGKAYNVRGKLGLQLYLKNNSKVLFGTQRKSAIADATNKMMNSALESPI